MGVCTTPHRESESRVNRRSFLTTAASGAAVSVLPERVEAQAAPASGVSSETRQAPAVRTRGPGGFSTARIARLRSAMNAYSERGDVPGIGWAVSRGREVHTGLHGVHAVGGDAIRRDSIFRIASVSKVITSAATMMLGWDGGYGTSLWVDPQERLVGVLLTQKVWTSANPPPSVHLDFWNMTYAALED